MKKEEVDEALDSLRVITNETHMLVVGTQSLHGTHPDAPDSIMLSREVDVVLKHKARLANWISDVVGDGTPFEAERGYFIDHVAMKEGMPVLAAGWEARVTRTHSMPGCTVDYLAPEDLAIAKLGAGRAKDLQFVQGMLDRGFVSTERIRELASSVAPAFRGKVETSLNAVEINRKFEAASRMARLQDQQEPAPAAKPDREL